MATVTKRGNSYKITVSCGYDMNNKQIRRTMTWKPPENMTARQVKKELQRQEVLFEDKCLKGQVLDSSIRFADFTERWLKDYAAVQIRPTTLQSYKNYLKRILPAIGHIRLDKLQPHHLQEFYRNLAETGVRADGKQSALPKLAAVLEKRKINRQLLSELAGVSCTTVCQLMKGKNVSNDTAIKISAALHLPMSDLFQPTAPDAVLSNNTIRHYHQVISTILSTAVEWQVLYANPCDRVRTPKVPHTEAEYLDDKQAVHMLELLEELPDSKFDLRTAITMLLFTGLRRSELLGLCWSDVDMETGVISVNHTSKYIPAKGIIEDDTKNTSSRRSFKAPSELLPLLKKYRAWQMEQRMRVGDQWKESNRIFTSWNGTPMRPDTLTNRFHKWILSTDLPPVHLHTLRHTNATLLIANGINIQTVSKRLGHSTASTTANIYAHAIQSADAAAAEAVSIFKVHQKQA